MVKLIIFVKSYLKWLFDSGKLTSNTKTYQETVLALGKALGSNAVLNAKDLETFTALREAAGLTNDELIELIHIQCS